ncbi:MAG: hypothetical protein OXG33_11265 [Chloroflexi bacterium]|nr:hypothetical protein [Chloroflexota bacterium]
MRTRHFKLGSHVMHILLTVVTFGSWGGIYWWRYQIDRYRWQEEMLLQLAERSE